MSIDIECGCCPGDPGTGGGGGQGRPPKIAGARVWKTGFPGFQPTIGVRSATAVNHPLTGLAGINGVVIVEGNYVLVKAQTDRSENGVYSVAAGAWTQVSAPLADLLVHVWEGNQAGWYILREVPDGIEVQHNDPVRIRYYQLFGREIRGGPEFIAVEPGAVEAPWQRNGTENTPTGQPFIDSYGILKTQTISQGSVSGSFTPIGSYRAILDGADRLFYIPVRGWQFFIPVTATPNWVRRTDTPAVVHPRIVPAGGFVKKGSNYFVARSEQNLTSYFTDPSTDGDNWAITNVGRGLPLRVESGLPPFARYRVWTETTLVEMPDGSTHTGTRTWSHQWQGSARPHTYTEISQFTGLDLPVDVPHEFQFPLGDSSGFELVEETAGGTSWTSRFRTGDGLGDFYTVTQTVEVSDPISDEEVLEKLRALIPASLNEMPWGFYQFRTYWSDGVMREQGLAGGSFSLGDGVNKQADPTAVGGVGFYTFGDSYVEGGIRQLDV